VRNVFNRLESGYAKDTVVSRACRSSDHSVKIAPAYQCHTVKGGIAFISLTLSLKGGSAFQEYGISHNIH
jgi:hypothetical protein